MTDTANRITIPRNRVPLTLDPDLIEWANDSSRTGGPFANLSHAVERALGHLRTEYQFIQDACKDKGVPFQADAFWALCEADLQHYKTGRRFKDESLNPPKRLKLYATVATELLRWVEQTCLGKGPLESLSQTVEVGLRRLRLAEARLHRAISEPWLTLEPAAFWKLYERQVQDSKRKPK
jgi:hypothetical protein